MTDSEPAGNDRRRPDPEWQRFNPWLFFGVLAAPAILSVIAFAFDRSHYGDTPMITWMVSSVAAGLICSSLFILSLQRQGAASFVMLWLLMFVACTALAAIIGVAGCGAFIRITDG